MIMKIGLVSVQARVRVGLGLSSGLGLGSVRVRTYYFLLNYLVHFKIKGTGRGPLPHFSSGVT